MGAVYVAHDPLLGRMVAIKVFSSELEFPDARERFAREARSAAALSHPHIVTVFDYGEYDAQPYIVMEYVPGKPLWAGVHGLGERDVARQFLDCLRACDFLGRQGIAHCDIKPDNILVGVDRSVRIGDFGVATHHGDAIKGLSPAFVAPEHLFGAEAAPASAATDLYSLAVSFYWLLTGAHPYLADGERTELRSKSFARRPALPTMLNPTMDRKWDACLMGLLSTTCDERLATAASILDAPERALPARTG